MLEGLEITIYRYKEIFEDNEEFRIDSEYYRKEYLSLFEKINESPNLVDLVYMSDLSTNGSFKTVSDIIHDGNDKVIPFIRSGNTGSLFIKKSELEFISKEAHSKLPKSTTSLHDVIMARKGKIGGASIVTEEEVDFNCNENVIKLTINEPEKINPWYFAIYFNSKYGIKQIERLATGNVQPWVPIFQIRKLKTHIASDNFQKVIADIGQTAHLLVKTSKERYEQAENLLLETLGLGNFQPSKEPINVKSFSESLGSSGRLDAEYYQIKYDDFETLVRTYSGGHEPFEMACSLKDKNFKPEDKTEYKYIELANIGKSGEITDCTTELGKELPTRARRKVAINDVVISSIEGSLSSCALVTPEYDNALCSTGFYVVNSKKLNPETLLVLFKSEPMQALLKKGCSGTILTAISKTELSKVPIPLIDKETQYAIKTKINESFELRKQSEHLLEVARTAVEMAVEQDEATALEFINNQTKI